ncbi:MAG: PDZ domain-containing protein, partial [Pseudomonadota bacterium]|nr:PDZ domain-containing protein [Pseudomonadota bacterium]
MPSITLSPDEIELRRSTSTGTVDFGLNVIPNESDSLFNIQSLPGVRVREVAANSPAAEAGIEVGDVILQIDETHLNHPDSLQALRSLPS